MAYHVSAAHWCLNNIHAEGRGLIDATDSSRGSSLNSPEVQEKAIALWGNIDHPTTTDLVEMIWKFYRRELLINPLCRWEDMRMWKMDLKGAYTLLSFHPDLYYRLSSFVWYGTIK